MSDQIYMHSIKGLKIPLNPVNKQYQNSKQTKHTQKPKMGRNPEIQMHELREIRFYKKQKERRTKKKKKKRKKESKSESQTSY